MRNDLVEDNLRLVHFIVHKFGELPSNVYEDYYQEGCYWLTLAAKRFDASKGFAFSTFASSYIYNGIKRYKKECGDDFGGLKVGRTTKDKISKLNIYAYNNGLDLENSEELSLVLDSLGFTNLKIPKVSSLDIDIKGDDGSSSSLYELIPDSRDDFLNSTLEYDLNLYLDYIKPKVKVKTYECIKAIIKIFLETGDLNYSKSELAEMLGTSRATISKILSEGLNLWKEFFS